LFEQVVEGVGEAEDLGGAVVSADGYRHVAFLHALQGRPPHANAQGKGFEVIRGESLLASLAQLLADRAVNVHMGDCILIFEYLYAYLSAYTLI